MEKRTAESKSRRAAKESVAFSALGAKLAEVKPDDREGRTYAEVVAANLVAIACSQGHNAVTAAAEIANRLEGRATQRLEMNEITADLANRSDEELRYHLANNCWPEDSNGNEE